MEIELDKETKDVLIRLVDEHNDTPENMIATGIHVLAILDGLGKLQDFI